MATKQISTLHTKYSQSRVRQKTAKNQRGTHFSTNPQRLSSSQGASKVLCGKKKEKTLRMMKNAQPVEKLTERQCREIVLKDLENSQDNNRLPRPCEKQVYASIAVAESTAVALMKMGVFQKAQVEKCEKCRLIHISEMT